VSSNLAEGALYAGVYDPNTLISRGFGLAKSAGSFFLAQHPEIQVEYLPPYAPELNPEEYCHRNVKGRMTNGVYHSKSEICKNLDAGFAHLRKRPDILLGCFQHAGLQLNQLW
jgi:transposase